MERTAEGAQALASLESARAGSSAGEPKMVWAVPCDCTAVDRTERALAKARVPERYRHCDFENYETDNEPENATREQLDAWNRSLAQAKLVVQRFAAEFPIGAERGLLLMGPCGVGKTHLAVSVLKEVVLRGHTGIFYDYRDLLKQIQDSYNPESQATEMSVLEPVLKAELLVLDDLGANKPSDWVRDTLGHVLNGRYNENQKCVTVITTNFPDEEFASRLEARPSPWVTFPSGERARATDKDTLADRVGQRIRSRLYEMCRTVEIWAPDYRKGPRSATSYRA